MSAEEGVKDSNVFDREEVKNKDVFDEERVKDKDVSDEERVKNKDVFDEEGVKNKDVFEIATKLVAVSIATGVIDYFEESVNDTNKDYRQVIERARECTASSSNHADLYEHAHMVRNILEDYSEEVKTKNSSSATSKSSTCSLL